MAKNPTINTGHRLSAQLPLNERLALLWPIACGLSPAEPPVARLQEVLLPPLWPTRTPATCHHVHDRRELRCEHSSYQCPTHSHPGTQAQPHNSHLQPQD